MSMSRFHRESQPALFIPTADLPRGAGHPFYDRVNQVLAETGFDDFVESQCEAFYADKSKGGRPSIPPGVYFRMHMIGYFEGIDSERGIAWRAADSWTLRDFLGYEATDRTPDHSSLSRIRQRLDLETHESIFQFVLAVLAQADLLKGRTLGVDGSTLEANAAMRRIVRRDTGEDYQTFLEGLAKASGIETPTREDLAKLDRSRKNKASNKDWEHPHDPDARIGKMKDGTTHMAHKVEHAVDMETGAVVAVTLQGADEGDTTTWRETIDAASSNLDSAKQDEKAAEKIVDETAQEIVGDKGYHSNQTMIDLKEIGARSYIPEPDRGKRNWKGKEEARQATYANRRRTKGKRGKALMRKRGELIERSFAHAYETGGLRRVYLRGRENILKRLLIHIAGLNLGILMRRLFGAGTPRSLQGRKAALRALVRHLYQAMLAAMAAITRPNGGFPANPTPRAPSELIGGSAT